MLKAGMITVGATYLSIDAAGGGYIIASARISFATLTFILIRPSSGKTWDSRGLSTPYKVGRLNSLGVKNLVLKRKTGPNKKSTIINR